MDMVIVEHVSDIPNLSNFLSVGPVWYRQSIILTMMDGLTVTRWYFNVFVCLPYTAYSKRTISGFSVSPGSVETPLRWGGKIKHWIEQGLTSHQTHYRSYRGRVFIGQMTQPTVSMHWRKIGPKDRRQFHQVHPTVLTIIHTVTWAQCDKTKSKEL